MEEVHATLIFYAPLLLRGQMGKLSHMNAKATKTSGFVPTWEIQDRIARARRHAGMEQSELAEAAGMSRKSVSNYEIGKTVPRRSAIIAIAFATGVDVNWLETGKTQRQFAIWG